MVEEKHEHKPIEGIKEEKSSDNNKEKMPEIKQEDKKGTKKQEKVKREYAIVNAKNVNMSLKHAVAICRVIRQKSISEAISFLEQVLRKEKAVPMKGELPHRKGMMSGRYPAKASEMIIKILKSLMANSIANGLDIDEVIISDAIPNTGGRATASKKGKKVHLTLIAREKSRKKDEQKKENEESKK